MTNPLAVDTPAAPQLSAQEIAQELLDRLQADARLREEFAAFHRTKHRKAVAYALKLVDSREEAEDLVSRTYLELIRGKTDIRHFFNALRCNCLNRIESAEREGAVILRIGELKADQQSDENAEEELDDESFLESISSRRDDQDPALASRDVAEQHKKFSPMMFLGGKVGSGATVVPGTMEAVPSRPPALL